MLDWLKKLFDGRGVLFGREGQKNPPPEPIVREFQLHKDHPQRALRPRRQTRVLSVDEAKRELTDMAQGKKEPGPLDGRGPGVA